MKKLILFFVLLLSYASYSQEDAWVYFTDKPNSQFYFDNPLEMLSQRALDRRNMQNIPLDTKDVPIHQNYIDLIQASVGITVKAKSKWMNCLHVRGSIAAISALTSHVFVDHVQFANRNLNASGRLNYTVKMQPVNKQLDTQVVFNYGTSGNQIQMLNGHLLHQQNYTGTGKIIAVMDAGFPNVDLITPFQRIRDNNQILGGYNFVDRNTNFYTRNAHGTMVLSTMAGFVDNELIGTAPDAGYYLFITEDTDSENPIEESNWVEAAEMADMLGVDIINTSLGYFAYDNPNYSYTYQDINGVTSFVSKGANIAFSRGMICVTSAGNSGLGSSPNISVPADSFNTLTVGAVQSNENYATFSSIGPSFDGRIKPEIMAQGQAAVLSASSGSIGTASGTSFSSPIMAGMIASFWQSIPQASNQEVIQFVKQSSDRYINPNNQFGYGIPDFQIALNMALLSVIEAEKTAFVVFPNPIKDKVSLLFPNNVDEANVVICNALGQKVFDRKLNKYSSEISMESIVPGVYFYTIQVGVLQQSGKLIKK